MSVVLEHTNLRFFFSYKDSYTRKQILVPSKQQSFALRLESCRRSFRQLPKKTRLAPSCPFPPTLPCLLIRQGRTRNPADRKIVLSTPGERRRGLGENTPMRREDKRKIGGACENGGCLVAERDEHFASCNFESATQVRALSQTETVKWGSYVRRLACC